MKRIFVLSTFISFAMICACQKDDSAAEAQLAQQKAELDKREKELDEREKTVAEWEKAIATSRAVPSNVQSPKPVVDPEEAKAERERRIQRLPPEFQALIRDRSLLETRTAAKPRATEDPAERERRIQQLPPEIQALIPDRSLPGSRTTDKNAATEDRAAQLKRLVEERRKKMNEIASPNAQSSDTQSSSPSPSVTPE